MKKQKGFIDGGIVFALFIAVIVGNASGATLGKSAAAQAEQVQVSQAK